MLYQIIFSICVFFITQTAFASEVDDIAKKKKPKPKSYKYQLSASLMFQNEGRFLKEWIEFHRLIGVEHFFLFDNASTDNYLEILQPYINAGIVEVYHYPHVSNNQKEYLAIQNTINAHAIVLARHSSKWLAMIDADEFIVPLQTDSLLPILQKYENFGGIYVNWLNFGTSGVEKIPDDRLMIDMLNHCGTVGNLGKSIVRADRVSSCTDPHRMFYYPPYYHVNTNFQKFDWVCPIAADKLIIFHYYTGDLYNLINVKFPRRQKWIGIELASYIQGMDAFNANQNDTMQRFVPLLKLRMGFP